MDGNNVQTLVCSTCNKEAKSISTRLTLDTAMIATYESACETTLPSIGPVFKMLGTTFYNATCCCPSPNSRPDSKCPVMNSLCPQSLPGPTSDSTTTATSSSSDSSASESDDGNPAPYIVSGVIIVVILVGGGAFVVVVKFGGAAAAVKGAGKGGCQGESPEEVDEEAPEKEKEKEEEEEEELSDNSNNNEEDPPPPTGELGIDGILALEKLLPRPPPTVSPPWTPPGTLPPPTHHTSSTGATEPKSEQGDDTQKEEEEEATTPEEDQVEWSIDEEKRLQKAVEQSPFDPHPFQNLFRDLVARVKTRLSRARLLKALRQLKIRMLEALKVQCDAIARSDPKHPVAAANESADTMLRGSKTIEAAFQRQLASLSPIIPNPMYR